MCRGKATRREDCGWTPRSVLNHNSASCVLELEARHGLNDPRRLLEDNAQHGGPTPPRTGLVVASSSFLGTLKHCLRILPFVSPSSSLQCRYPDSTGVHSLTAVNAWARAYSAAEQKAGPEGTIWKPHKDGHFEKLTQDWRVGLLSHSLPRIATSRVVALRILAAVVPG